MSKELKRPYVECVGNSALDVTGSSYLVRFKDYSILIEYGATQTADSWEDYKSNRKRHKSIKPKNLDAIILCHQHQDHIQNVPSLFKDGANCPIYVPKGSTEIMRIMWYDCCKIFECDCEKFKKLYGVSASPLYTFTDVDNAINHVIEIDFGVNEPIFNDINLKYYEANHIVNSAQMVLELVDNSIIKRIHYSSDLGSLSFDNYYCQSFSRVEKSNIAIIETTYATEPRGNKKSDRPKDIEKIKTLVEQIKESKGKIIIPVFSLNRSQDVLTLLYEIYHDDEDFNLPIIFDAPLASKLCDMWQSIIPKNQELWKNVWSWDKIIRVESWMDSSAWQVKNIPMIVLASGGFLSGGRAVNWTKKCLPNDKNYMCFVGYGGGENSIVYKIKHCKQYPSIKIDGELISNQATIISLNSFSSHIDHKDLLEYASSLNCEKIILVHGEKEKQEKFVPILKEALSKQNKSTKVLISQKDMKIYL